MFYDCRYLSPRESVLRIFGFDINFKEPSVERLSFHLLKVHIVIFPDDEPIDSVVKKKSHKMTMFSAWFEANKKYPDARRLIYSKFPTKFMYKTKFRE